MSLALVSINQSSFEQLYDHLITHKPPYRNLHLREACQRGGKRVLKYLHAMQASRESPEIEGMICGPGIYWHYSIVRTRNRTQLKVYVEQASRPEKTRMLKRFLAEITKRVQQEKSGNHFHPKRIPGQYYLRRRRSGTHVSHPHCVQAIAQGVLDARFVSKLSLWDLELLCP